MNKYWTKYCQHCARGAPISRVLTAKILQEFAGQKQAASDSRLSEREKEALQLISQWLNNKEIGENLYLSESTVKNHL